MPRLRVILLLAAALLLGILGVLAVTGVFATAGHETGKSENKPRAGLEIVLRTYDRKLTANEMAGAVSVMRRRLKKLGVTGFGIRSQGANRIVISGLHHIRGVARMASVIGSAGQLQFFDLETSLTGPSVKDFAPRPLALYPLLQAVASEVKVRGASSYYLFARSHELVAGPAGTPKQLQSLLLRTRRARKKSDTVLATPHGTVLVSCDLKTSHYCPSERGGFYLKKTQTWYYLFKLPPQLTGKDLNSSGIRADYGSNGPIVDLSFTSHGNKVFYEITRREWSRGQTHGPQHFAVVLDGRLITFPYIDPKDRSLAGGIDPSFSGAVIEGIGSSSEAKDIATVLQTGALPVRFEMVARKVVPAMPNG